jgi:inner membrane protein
MKGKTHMLIGITAGIAVANFTNQPIDIIMLSALAGGFGGLLPDIDHINSKFGRKIVPVSWVLYNTVGHRTITHSLAFILLCSLPAIALEVNQPYNYLGLAFFAGVVLHIVADGFTAYGVPLLYPLNYRFRVPVIWTMQRLIEFLFTVGCAVVLLAFLFVDRI